MKKLFFSLIMFVFFCTNLLAQAVVCPVPRATVTQNINQNVMSVGNGGDIYVDRSSSANSFNIFYPKDHRTTFFTTGL